MCLGFSGQWVNALGFGVTIALKSLAIFIECGLVDLVRLLQPMPFNTQAKYTYNAAAHGVF